MTKQIMTPAMHEMRIAFNELDELSSKPELSKRDEARINILLAKVAALRKSDVTVDETTKKWFRAFITGDTVPEVRSNVLAGSQTLSYTQGAAGGFLVPVEFNDELIIGMAQFDPLLDENITTVIQSSSFALRPFEVPSWDLSTYKAVKVTEGTQQNAQSAPAASNKILNSYTYRASLGMSFEFEEDAFEPAMDLFETAITIGMARGIGIDLVTGNGTTAPQGVLTGAHDSAITTGSAGVISMDDIENVYFSVDRFYRAQEKCGWVVSDTVYEQIRKAKDLNNRPLLSVLKDKEVLMGKPIYVSPSMPSTAGSQGIVFGDLSHYVVHVSQMTMTRNLQLPGYVENGQGFYTAHMRADAAVIDPTAGAKPPIVFATLHA